LRNHPEERSSLQGLFSLAVTILLRM